jgi:hypothetical protein
MITPLHLPGEYAATWGNVYARLAERMAPLGLSGFLRPRLFPVPEWNQRVIPHGGHVEASIVLVPGSFVWGILNAPFYLLSAVTDQHFVVQITDVSLRHKLFSEPVPAEFFQRAPAVAVASAAQCSKIPWLFEAPYPVTGSGLFVVDFWNATELGSPGADDMRRWCEITLAVAERRCNGN